MKKFIVEISAKLQQILIFIKHHHILIFLLCRATLYPTTVQFTITVNIPQMLIKILSESL